MNKIILSFIVLMCHVLAINAQAPSVVQSSVAPSEAQSINKQAEQTSHTLSAAYPLRRIKVTSNYGYRRDPITGQAHRWHGGIDLRAYYEPVYAMFSGRVLSVRTTTGGGLTITLQHGDHITVTYSHLSRSLVSKGDQVHAGQPIAISGNSGKRTVGRGHLHLSATYKNSPINPIELLLWVVRGN